VTFLGVRQTSLFAAFAFGFEVVATTASFESTEETVPLATVFIGLDSVFERKFF